LKRIYLDQNMWIELSRARLGAAGAKDGFRDAYEIARYASLHGLASFVLSQTHMYETQKRRQWDQRLDIVETMLELSRFHAIKHVTGVVPLEADFAVRSMAGLRPTEPNVFGHGVQAIFSKAVNLHDGLLLDLSALDYRDSFVKAASALGQALMWDAILLAGPRPGSSSEELVASLKAVDDAFAVDQADVAAKIKSLSIRGPQLEEALTQYALLEVRHELFRAAQDCGISPEFVADMMIERPGAMLQALPSRHVVHGMYMQHAQPQKLWKSNDLHDITALGVAVPYCDAVATEKHWVSLLRRKALDVQYNTSFITSPRELVEYLTNL
jgi:hypothetical protein